MNRAVPGPEDQDDDSDDDDDDDGAPEREEEQAYAADAPNPLKGLSFKKHQREQGQLDDAAPAKYASPSPTPSLRSHRLPPRQEKEEGSC